MPRDHVQVTELSCRAYVFSEHVKRLHVLLNMNNWEQHMYVSVYYPPTTATADTQHPESNDDQEQNVCIQVHGYVGSGTNSLRDIVLVYVVNTMTMVTDDVRAPFPAANQGYSRVCLNNVNGECSILYRSVNVYSIRLHVLEHVRKVNA